MMRQILLIFVCCLTLLKFIKNQQLCQSGNSGFFLSLFGLWMLHKKLVFLPQPSIIDTRQTRNNLTTKFKAFLATSCLVKLHYFQFAFLEHWVYKKTKEINKRSREFLFKHFKKHFFKVFANNVSIRSKIWCSRFSYEQNDIIFFIPPVGDLPEIKDLYLTNTIPSKYEFCFFLSIIKVSIYGN